MDHHGPSLQKNGINLGLLCIGLTSNQDTLGKQNPTVCLESLENPPAHENLRSSHCETPEVSQQLLCKAQDVQGRPRAWVIAGICDMICAVTICCYMGVSENSGTPTSSILIGFFQYKPSNLGYHYFRKHPYVAQSTVPICCTKYCYHMCCYHMICMMTKKA